MRGRWVWLALPVVAGIVVAAVSRHLVCAGQALGESQLIALAPPRLESSVSVEAAIAKRRSVRSFAPTPLTLEEIGQLAWAAQGLTDPTRKLRAAPSAGALYPLEVYFVCPDGLFHYLPDGHKLERKSDKDVRGALSEAALGQDSVAKAAADVVVAAVYERTAKKYGDRAERYVHIEVGHVGQNIHLQAVALGLGSVSIGAFVDEKVKEVLGLPEDEAPLYIIPVGHRAEG